MTWYSLVWKDTRKPVPHSLWEPDCDCDGGVEIEDPSDEVVTEMAKYGMVFIHEEIKRG